jgi:hypothetical protein
MAAMTIYWARVLGFCRQLSPSSETSTRATLGHRRQSHNRGYQRPAIRGRRPWAPAAVLRQRHRKNKTGAKGPADLRGATTAECNGASVIGIRRIPQRRG